MIDAVQRVGSDRAALSVLANTALEALRRARTAMAGDNHVGDR